MDRAVAFAGFDFRQAIGHAAVTGAAGVVPGSTKGFVALLGVFQDVRQAECSEATCAVEPVLGVAANQPRAELRVGIKAAIGRSGGQVAALQRPEKLVSA